MAEDGNLKLFSHSASGHVEGVVMGQAAIDLPDSIDQSPAPLNSADDLLSQLAGAEIDRLLAEADPSEAVGDPALNAAFDEAACPKTEAELNELLKTAEAEAQAAAAESAAGAAAPSATDFAAEANAVLTEIDAPASATAPDSAAAAAAQLANQGTSIQSPQDVQELQTRVAEREALNAPVPEPTEELDESPIPFRAGVEQKPSILVGVLELINAPFAAVPDVIRDTLGKIAILTLMNSLAVLLYLFLFGRH